MNEARGDDTVRVSFESKVFTSEAGDRGDDVPAGRLYVTSPKGLAIHVADIGAENIEVIKRAASSEPTEPGTVVLVGYKSSYKSVAIRCEDHSDGAAFDWEVSGQDGYSSWGEVIALATSVEVIKPGCEVKLTPVGGQTATTEAEYEALPTGSLVASRRTQSTSWTKRGDNDWTSSSSVGARYADADIWGITRQVLRHGWGDDA
jgi:hypothetical protein